jgi:hypothetical protein
LLWRFACLIVCLFVVGADFLFYNLHRYVSLQLTLDVRNWILCLFCTLDSMLFSFFFGVCTVMFLVFLGTNFSFPCFHRLLLSLSNLSHTTLQVSWYGSCRFAIEGTTPSGHSCWGFPFLPHHN